MRALGRIAALAGLFAIAWFQTTGSSDPPEVPRLEGFGGGTGQPPVPGWYVATGVYREVEGYRTRKVGEKIVRRWLVERVCASGRCSFRLTRERRDTPPQAQGLVQARDGWRATFPLQRMSCRRSADGWVFWEESESIVLRFTDGGSRIEGRERSFSYEPRCGFGTSLVDWRAVAADGLT